MGKAPWYFKLSFEEIIKTEVEKPQRGLIFLKSEKEIIKEHKYHYLQIPFPDLRNYLTLYEGYKKLFVDKLGLTNEALIHFPL